MFSDAELRLARQAAAHRSWAKTRDRTERMAPAQHAAEARFLALVDPTITNPVERAQAAEHLRKAFYIDLARKSAQVRRARKRG